MKKEQHKTKGMEKVEERRLVRDFCIRGCGEISRVKEARHH